MLEQGRCFGAAVVIFQCSGKIAGHVWFIEVLSHCVVHKKFSRVPGERVAM